MRCLHRTSRRCCNTLLRVSRGGVRLRSVPFSAQKTLDAIHRRTRRSLPSLNSSHSEPRTDAHTISSRRSNETELARVAWIRGKDIPRQGTGKYAEDRGLVADILQVCAYEPGIVGRMIGQIEICDRRRRREGVRNCDRIQKLLRRIVHAGFPGHRAATGNLPVVRETAGKVPVPPKRHKPRCHAATASAYCWSMTTRMFWR